MQVKSANVKRVIDLFKSVLPMATQPDHLNMGECYVNQPGHGCGTIHCHGGWFAIACGLREEGVVFGDGVCEMANILEIPNPYRHDYAAVVGAVGKETIWGNIYSSFMFSNSIAFCHPVKRPDGAKTLSDIIDHWEEVYERVIALEYEQQVEISDPPVYIESFIEENVPA